MKRMRRFRIDDRDTVYHCMSRTNGGLHLFGDLEKDAFTKGLHKSAVFSGVEVLTFCVMSNHFHVLVRVPCKRAASLEDMEIWERARALYGDSRFAGAETWAEIDAAYRERGEAWQSIRERLEARMEDVSEFMKTLKQRYSFWYNRNHNRFGTLWADRFKSVIVEGTGTAAAVVAAYIDLNPVRAGLVGLPQDYRWCGFGEAMGGRHAARMGLCGLFRDLSWNQVRGIYVGLLYGKGLKAGPDGTPAGRIDREKARRTLEEGGELSLAEIVRCRVRYFSAGAIMGTERFIADCFARIGPRLRDPERKGLCSRLAGCAEWGDVRVFRNLRVRVFE